MMKRNYVLIALLLMSNLLIAQNKVIHYNIVIAPDLSNRLNMKLYPKYVSDPQIVSGVLKRIFPDILRIKRLNRQLDKFSVDFINKGLIGMYNVNTHALNIDFELFGERQLERIDYIMNRSVRKLNTDISHFNTEYARVNNKAAFANHGADIWTYFSSGIDENIIKQPIRKGNTTQVFRNILLLITDGYIEAGIFGKGYDLSKIKIDSFRKEYLQGGSTSLESFLKKNPKFKINPVINPHLRKLEVLVLEMYDRSLSKSGAATVHPTDMEIMKVIWSDWLRSSGVKHFQLKSIASNQAEVDNTIMTFIKNDIK